MLSNSKILKAYQKFDHTSYSWANGETSDIKIRHAEGDTGFVTLDK